MEEYDYLFKILLLGDSGVGKSCVLLRYADNTYTDAFITTIGVDFKIKELTLETEDGPKNVKLQIWDTAGQERFKTITRSFYKGSQGIVLVFDITNKESINNIKNWLEEIALYGEKDVQKILIGNKADLEDLRVISYEEGKALADELGIPFLEVSAKTNTGIEDVFLTMTREIYKNSPERKKEEVPGAVDLGGLEGLENKKKKKKSFC